MFKALLFVSLYLCMIGAASAADKVTLHYGWTPGIYIKVEGYQSQQKAVGDQPQPGMKIDLSYIMGTAEHKDGLQIDYLEVKASVHSEDSSLQAWMKKYIEAISAAMPSLIVSPEGEMRGAIELPKLREAMSKSLSQILSDAPAEKKQQLLAGLGQIFSDQFLNAQFAEDWNLIVGQWPGVELDDDSDFEAEMVSLVPALDNRPVKTVVQITLAGRVNCDDADHMQACVRLIYHSETDDVAMKDLLSKFVPPGQAVPELNLSIVSDAELVTDPDTLLPYRMKQTKRTISPMKTVGGFVTVTNVEESELKYRYLMGNKKS